MKTKYYNILRPYRQIIAVFRRFLSIKSLKDCLTSSGSFSPSSVKKQWTTGTRPSFFMGIPSFLK